MSDCVLTSPAMFDLTRPHPVREYLEHFSGDFARRDQLRWAEAYLRGLLADLRRKNIENIARHLIVPRQWRVGDPKQALQNFLNQSPWDENKVWRRYRALMARHFGRRDGTFVIQELPFVKQGRHSVGVHRQYSRALGEKTNCQVAVGIHYVSAAGEAPLALRLYLPGSWLADEKRLDAAGAPLDRRRKISRSAIALELLDELRAEAFPANQVAVAPSFPEAQDLMVELSRQGLACGENNMPPVADSIARMKQDLGLDHFEGRSWRGFHHHGCLVMLAFGFTVLYPMGEF